MSCTPRELRQQIEAELVAALQPHSWVVSRFHYDMFPGADVRSVEAHAFAVGVPETELKGRQNRLLPFPAVTQVGVRWSYRLRGQSQTADMDAALQQEEVLLNALRTLTQGAVTLEKATRELKGDGTVCIGQVTGFVPHAHT